MNDIATTVPGQSLTRRHLLQLGIVSLTASPCLAASTRPASSEPFRCVFINLVGGPGHVDTFDPKPGAPSEYRGPFRPISTNVPGIQLSELFPRLARMADRFAMIRSVFHDAPPIHETGLQLVQQGKLGQPEQHLYRRMDGSQSGVLLPGPMENTGVQLSQGQESLVVEPIDREAALSREPARLREAYGMHEFGQSCLLARQLLERGQRCITINMFRTVYDALSWDCHADGGSLNTSLEDYRTTAAPMFDGAFSTLLADLETRGLLASTLVVATGEFGRSPKINLRGGRDHWAGAWTALFAGGGVRGGQVIGKTDRLGKEPTDRPVHASAIANTVLHAAGAVPNVIHPFGGPVVELFGTRQSS